MCLFEFLCRFLPGESELFEVFSRLCVLFGDFFFLRTHPLNIRLQRIAAGVKMLHAALCRTDLLFIDPDLSFELLTDDAGAGNLVSCLLELFLECVNFVP